MKLPCKRQCGLQMRKLEKEQDMLNFLSAASIISVSAHLTLNILAFTAR